MQAQNPRGQKLRPVRIIVFLSYKFNKLSNLAAAKVDIIFDIGEYYFIKYPSNKYKNGCHLTVYSRFFKLYIATAIAPVPLASFAGQPSSSIGVAFLKSYAAICLEGCVIVLACVIFSAFASSPPAIADDTLAAATIVWNYVGELIFNMLVLVGTIKTSDRLIRELMGLS